MRTTILIVPVLLGQCLFILINFRSFHLSCFLSLSLFYLALTFSLSLLSSSFSLSLSLLTISPSHSIYLFLYISLFLEIYLGIFYHCRSNPTRRVTFASHQPIARSHSRGKWMLEKVSVLRKSCFFSKFCKACPVRKEMVEMK